MKLGSLERFRQIFGDVGWFIPPYIRKGLLDQLAKQISDSRGQYKQETLQENLSAFYEPYGLSSMVIHRYPFVPFIKDFRITISESIDAHFLGLDHIAVGGLIPVIEGVVDRLSASRHLRANDVKARLQKLVLSCIKEAETKSLGNVTEVISMLNSFNDFSRDHFYIGNRSYKHSDNSNRHGISHGVYSDKDYGTPLNFYKVIACVDFLTFVSSFRGNISWMAPDISPQSIKLAQYYEFLRKSLQSHRAMLLSPHPG